MGGVFSRDVAAGLVGLVIRVGSAVGGVLNRAERALLRQR